MDDRLRHRLGVYLGLRQDPDLTARWKAGRVDAQTTVIGLTLGLSGILAAAYLVVLAGRVLLGYSTDPSHVISGAWDVIRAIVTATIVWSGLTWLWRRPRRRPPA